MNDNNQTPSAKAEARLDEELKETFPASDPPTLTRREATTMPPDAEAHATACEHKAHDSRALDRALSESFPASDPPSIVQPHGPEDEDTAGADCPMP